MMNNASVWDFLTDCEHERRCDEYDAIDVVQTHRRLFGLMAGRGGGGWGRLRDGAGRHQREAGTAADRRDVLVILQTHKRTSRVSKRTGSTLLKCTWERSRLELKPPESIVQKKWLS